MKAAYNARPYYAKSRVNAYEEKALIKEHIKAFLQAYTYNQDRDSS